MLKLVKLELKRTNIRNYLIASLIISVVMLGFTYLFAYAPQLEPNDPDLLLFSGYNNVMTLIALVNMAVFCTLSAVMHSRFVIDEYIGNRTILLFSYPIKRESIMLAKLTVVFMFTVLAMVASNILVFSIFTITEMVFPLVDDTLTLATVIRISKLTLIFAIIAAQLGIVALGIGFIKKSVPTTIISALLLSSLFTNIMGNALTNDTVAIVFMGVTFLAGTIVAILLMNNVKRMEVE